MVHWYGSYDILGAVKMAKTVENVIYKVKKWNWSEKIHSIAKKKNDHESFCMGLKYVHENKKKNL